MLATSVAAFLSKNFFLTNFLVQQNNKKLLIEIDLLKCIFSIGLAFI